MKISTSMLSIENNFEYHMNELNNSKSDYFHLDVMDGNFVLNNSIIKMDELLKFNSKPIDIHLMVTDPKYYIDKYKIYNPKFITIHIELGNVKEIISYIKDSNIKAGIAINPDTNLNEIYNYLDEIDLILVMSVEPGMGGQTFISDTTKKIDDLIKLRHEKKYNYLIEVDGGINSNTIKLVDEVDIVVSGSFLTNGNIDDNIVKLKNI